MNKMSYLSERQELDKANFCQHEPDTATSDAKWSNQLGLN